MDRWMFARAGYRPSGAEVLFRAIKVSVYDGEDDTPTLHKGEMALTPNGIHWHHPQQSAVVLEASIIIMVEQFSESGFFSSTHRATLHLAPVSASSAQARPVTYSQYHSVQVAFKTADDLEKFSGKLQEVITRVTMMSQASTLASSGANTAVSGSTATVPRPQSAIPAKYKQIKMGVVGIEQSKRSKDAMTSKNITTAFTDMKDLLAKAEEMVKISKSISEKTKETQGAISDDETVQFQAYLLSLGIPNPVTQSSSAKGFHYELSKEICQIIAPILRHRKEERKSQGDRDDAGNKSQRRSEESSSIRHQMTEQPVLALTDAYCYINRARALNLVSPDDFWTACNMHLREEVVTAASLIKMVRISPGVYILQENLHVTNAQDAFADNVVVDYVKAQTKATFEQFAITHKCGLAVAKQVLLKVEKNGALCRDDSVEGLFFYPNLFLIQP